MSCMVNKWGRGTTCEKSPNSAVAKELEKKLASMLSERTNQDAGIFVRSNQINPTTSVVKQAETTTSTYTSSYDLYRKQKQFS